MSLSEQEQRALRELEQQLLAEDPKFGASVAQASAGSPSGAVTLRGVALVVVGLVMLVGGVALAQNSLWFVVLSILGFLVMFGAGIWMLRGGGAAGSKSGKKKSGSGRGGAGASRSGGSSMGNKLEENFRRRFEGN